MPTKSARALVPGDRIRNDQGDPEVIRYVQVVAFLHGGHSKVFMLPEDVEYEEPLSDEEMTALGLLEGGD